MLGGTNSPISRQGPQPAFQQRVSGVSFEKRVLNALKTFYNCVKCAFQVTMLSTPLLCCLQTDALNKLQFGDYSTWQDLPTVIESFKSSLRNEVYRDTDAAATVMGLASELFSW